MPITATPRITSSAVMRADVAVVMIPLVPPRVAWRRCGRFVGPGEPSGCLSPVGPIPDGSFRRSDRLGGIVRGGSPYAERHRIGHVMPGLVPASAHPQRRDARVEA